MPKRPELADNNVPNLHVMKAMQSLKSRGYMQGQLAWRHFCWHLTNEGIQDLHDYLHPPPEIVPAALRRSRPETGRPRPEGVRPVLLTRGEADRATYRRSAVLLQLTRRPRPVLSQPPRSSSQADLFVNVVSHLSKARGLDFLLNKHVARKKKTTFFG